MLVIIEESYKITAWCREILDGLRQEARKKRANLTFSSDLNDIFEQSGEKAIVLVGAETEWLKLTVAKVKSVGKHPIVLSNQSDSALGGGVSQVTEDIEGSMKEICEYFAQKSKNRIALYAANPASASDEYRRQAFLSFGGKSEDIFTNEGSLSRCFDDFIKSYEAKGYDGIICSNDFAAISLIRHMREKNIYHKSIEIISYSNTLISNCFSPSVSSVKANYSDFGQMAFMISDCLSKSEVINGIRIFGKWEIVHRETSAPISCFSARNEELPSPATHSGKFYEDSELLEMVRLENMLSECDGTDIYILKMIIDEKKLCEIEENSFLTETAIKYRIRKMKEQCYVESRSQLRDLLVKYIYSSENLAALKL